MIALLASTLFGCAPQDAELSGHYFSWLAASTSATVDEENLALEKATVFECSGRGWDSETEDWDLGYIGPRQGESGDARFVGGDCAPDDSNCDADKLAADCEAIDATEYHNFLQDDGYYLVDGEIDPWRTEVLINSEGDFQLTAHHDLGDGQDFRFSFAIDPDFEPVDCLTDENGDPVIEWVDGASWLDQWKVDEDGYTIYYLNAGAFQVDPFDADIGWYLVSEWNAGYGFAKFAAEEYNSVPNAYGNLDNTANPDRFLGVPSEDRGECGLDRATAPPLCDAGGSLVARAGDSVSLVGGGEDPDGDTMTWSWSMSPPTGSEAALDSDESASTSFTPDLEGTYTLTLTGSDGVYECTDVARVYVASANDAPLCASGGDQATEVDSAVVLDASATSDANGDALTAAWTVSSEPATSTDCPDGAKYTLDDGDTLAPTFTPHCEGTYTLALAVDDGDESCAASSVVTSYDSGSAGNLPPLCDAGTDQWGEYGDTYQLSGTASDPEGGALTYAWVVVSDPSGASAEPIDATSEDTTIEPDRSGTWTVAFTATDSAGDSCSSSVDLIVHNDPPLCDDAGDMYVPWGEAVNLDASGTTDPQDNPLTYRWGLSDKPECSEAGLNLTDATVSFDRDIQGDYSFVLEVSDGDKSCSATIDVALPCDDNYLGRATCFDAERAAWQSEMVDVARARYSEDEGAFVHKIEDNFWRNIDTQDYGIDGWMELSSSWVRIKDGSKIEPGGKVEGDYQILFEGAEATSVLLVTGTFSTEKIEEDKWGYSVIEDDKRDENGTPYCGGAEWPE